MWEGWLICVLSLFLHLINSLSSAFGRCDVEPRSSPGGVMMATAKEVFAGVLLFLQNSLRTEHRLYTATLAEMG